MGIKAGPYWPSQHRRRHEVTIISTLPRLCELAWALSLDQALKDQKELQAKAKKWFGWVVSPIPATLAADRYG